MATSTMATTAATTSNTTPPTTTTIPLRNPKDSMKSTWRTADRKTWNHHHWLCEVLAIHPTDLNRPVPVHAKSDKMAYLPHWQGHCWVLLHACWPLVLHQLYASLTGHNPGFIVVALAYTLAFKINAVHELHMLRDLTHTYGTLDGDKHARDDIPDHSVNTVFRALFATATVRPMMATFLAYRAHQTPSSMSWWLPVEIGAYAVILDFWFYWYHRAMHDVDALWKYHRTHHLTKHPNPLLTLYADHEQEFFDMVVIPLLTWASMKLLGLPMGFYEWWICQQYIVFTELFGHSGIRLLVTPPTTATPLLRLFDAELITEDHDLHHRKGWKQSHNYGKQTRLWDRLFGTCYERYESLPANIDYNSPARLRYF